MLFNSQAFVLVFLPAVLAIFYAAPTLRWRQAVLVVASLAFYGYWDLRFVPALAGLTLAVWLIARVFQATGWNWVPVAGIALNLGVLGACKYANFIGANLAALAGVGFTPFSVILPLGVSFFTFQKISYLSDLRRGDRHSMGCSNFSRS
jgi:alginate O-acetyltransferase complex protein AlgI